MFTVTTIASNPKAIAPPRQRWIGERFLIAWPCMRLARGERGSERRGLERVQFVVSVEPMDRHHAALEAWMECEGQPPRHLLERQTRRCVITEDGAMLHIDQPDHDEQRLLALTLSRTDAGARLVYARTTLLSQAGFASGVFDAPTLRSAFRTSPA